MIRMSSLKFFIIFVFLLCLSSSLFSFTSAANPTYLFHFCSAENFTRNSTYQSNLNVLLSSLPSDANSSDGFSNSTAGQEPNKVYGLFQCRGDVTTSTCQDCVAFASAEATERCPSQKGAVLWYDECLLHYNASDFFSTAVLRPRVMLYNTNNLTIEPDRFHQIMLSLMYESATQAANDPKRFGTRKGDSTTYQTLYTLAQCTRDLSSTDCFGCLKEAISILPNVSIGGRRLLPSCHCRYEIYPFYEENETLPPAPSPTYLHHFCSAENFIRYSTYESNLNFLLSSLPSKASSSNGFSNAAVGQDPNRVYGLFQCRGDVTTSTCRYCVDFASREATQFCPAQKGAVFWYDKCLLHYSASDFFSTVVLKPSTKIYNKAIVETLPYQSSQKMYNTSNVEPYPFYQLMLSLMNESATKAANDPKRFTTTEKYDVTSQTPYILVQCTQDLSSTGCARCLREAISQLPNESTEGSVLYPSCYCRFGINPFNSENPPPAPMPSPPHTPSAPPPVTRPEGKSRISSSINVAIVVPVTVSVLLFLIAAYFFLTRRARKKYNAVPEEIAGNILTIEALQFDFGTIQAATNRFSTDNKLGTGGFGEVYKGVLPNGQEIAVKRLSKTSKQGAKEFKNEVIVVAKLQHKNLVRLQGFCLDGEEKILVYEFVPNKSLDYFLYDTIKQGQLDWSTRYKIIGGIARGILYLHEDSRPRIIHRDLKASNVLLDENMNPKISDFGLAKIFGVDQIEGSTSKIVGTYFGVLVLEITTGRKNSSFYQTDRVRNLLSYAWEHWRDETPMQLLDSTLIGSYSKNEVMRCIHVGLLCVQEDPAVRPTMATVVHMLNSYSVSLPLPQQPAFFLGTRTELKMHTPSRDSDQSTSKSMPWSVDDASITELNPR